MMQKKPGCSRLRLEPGKRIALFAVAVFVLLGFAPAIGAKAQQNAAAQPPQQADSGPSMAVTLQFIQDKLKAKLNPTPQDVVADQATCVLKLVDHKNSQSQSIGYYGGIHVSPTEIDEETSIPFRDVEKIEVMTGQQFQTMLGADDADSATGFVLKLTMTTNTSVTRHTVEHCEKDGERCLRDGDNKKVSSSENVTHAGSWVGWFSDSDVPNRIAKAMDHAAELCGGGKEEPF